MADENGVLVPKSQRQPGFHDRLAQLVIVPYYEALYWTTDYYGWLNDWFAELTADLDRLLPGMLHTGPQPTRFRAA